MSDIQLIELRVRPAACFTVTKFVQEDEGQSSSQIGEYDNYETAYAVAYAIAKQEHERLGFPVDDDRIQYPKYNPPGLSSKVAPENTIRVDHYPFNRIGSVPILINPKGKKFYPKEVNVLPGTLEKMIEIVKTKLLSEGLDRKIVVTYRGETPETSTTVSVSGCDPDFFLDEGLHKYNLSGRTMQGDEAFTIENIKARWPGYLMYPFNSSEPENLADVQKAMLTNHGEVVSKAAIVVLDKAGVTNVATKSSWQNYFDPYSKLEIIAKGKLGMAFGMEVYTDSYMDPKYKFLEDSYLIVDEIIVDTMPSEE